MYSSKYQRYAVIQILWAMFQMDDAFAATATDNNQVTVYRCTDSTGKVSLQDVPCKASSTQEISKMTRPKDSPPSRSVTVKTTPLVVTASPQPTQIISQRRPPPDLYQCTDFDGKVRESEFYDPRPRCVPLWVQGYQSPSSICSWVEDSCVRFEGKALCDRWIAKQKQAVLNADRPSAENTDFKKAEAARLTQIVTDGCW